MNVWDVAVAMPMRPTLVSLPSGSRSTSTRGVTVRSIREPPRSILSVSGSPARVEIVSASSSHVSIGWPFSATTRSRGWSPASAAGMPGRTSPTTGGRYGRAPMLQASAGSLNGVRTGTLRGVTVTSWRAPSRTIVSASGRPLARVTASSISPQCSTGFPSIAATRSRGRSPACPAAESAVTRPIFGSSTATPTTANTTEKIIAARTKFMPGPAKTISARAQRGFVEKDFAGSTGGSAVEGWIASSPWASSPVILT